MDYNFLFDRFMRDYLTNKTRRIPNIKNVYEAFKTYYSKQGDTDKVDVIIADMYKYSEYFVKMALEKEDNPKLREAFYDLNELRVDVAYPFLLNVYHDFEEDHVNQGIFLEILNFIQSYVFKRFVCGIPTNSLNKTFATFCINQ